MGLVLDVIFAAVTLWLIVSGYRAGLVRTLVELIGYVLAVIASVVLTGFVTDVICGFFLQSRSPSAAEYYFLRMIATVIVFVLLQMVVRIAASALDAVFRLPLLNLANSLLGALFGALKGVVLVFLLCSLVQVASPVFEMDDVPLDQQKLFQTSYVYQAISSHNPVYSLFRVEDFLKDSGM